MSDTNKLIRISVFESEIIHSKTRSLGYTNLIYPLPKFYIRILP